MKSIRVLLAISLIATYAVIPALGPYGLIPAFAQSVTPTFTGSAVGLAITDPLTGTTTFANTGNLTQCGIADPGGQIGVGNSLVSANINLAFTAACPDNVQSEVVVSAIGMGLIQIDFIRVAAIAPLVCPPAITTVFEMAGINIAGLAIAPTQAPNQVITIAGVGTLTLNEQVISSTGVRVTAAHFVADNGTEVIIGEVNSDIENCPAPTGGASNQPLAGIAPTITSSNWRIAEAGGASNQPLAGIAPTITSSNWRIAEAGGASNQPLAGIAPDTLCGIPGFPDCGGGETLPPPPPPTTPPTECPKTTGGGFIFGKNPTVDNGKANFGFNARPNLNGHLNYQDHTMPGMFHVKLDQQQTWACLDKCPDSDSPFDGVLNAREFGGPGSINGQTGFFIDVCVEDNGEPGNQPQGSDWFQIKIFSGLVLVYENMGRLQGGNIQVHRN